MYATKRLLKDFKYYFICAEKSTKFMHSNKIIRNVTPNYTENIY